MIEEEEEEKADGEEEEDRSRRNLFSVGIENKRLTAKTVFQRL